MRACVFANIVGVALGHGALFIPAPRNSQDNVLPQFKGGRSPATPCTCVNGNGNGTDGCDQGHRSGGDGQACLWWSQVSESARPPTRPPSAPPCAPPPRWPARSWRAPRRRT